ncbi:hypothetical protein BKA70DRAFT_857217 [Coprinopsis sp. MPI-PUGE-AT-0042]|nr:hypothetical protein BKA70DRAFT_857217 [Coprinopsis sp. MPI-PUGE-AT-0042]
MHFSLTACLLTILRALVSVNFVATQRYHESQLSRFGNYILFTSTTSNTYFFGPKLELRDNFSRDMKALLIRSNADAAVKASNECYDAHAPTLEQLMASIEALERKLEARDQKLKLTAEELDNTKERHKEAMKRRGSEANWGDISIMIQGKMSMFFLHSVDRLASWCQTWRRPRLSTSQ